LRELELSEKMINKTNENKDNEEDDFDDENFVRVPVKTINNKNEPIREFKTYKIIKRLEY